MLLGAILVPEPALGTVHFTHPRAYTLGAGTAAPQVHEYVTERTCSEVHSKPIILPSVGHWPLEDLQVLQWS